MRIRPARNQSALLACALLPCLATVPVLAADDATPPEGTLVVSNMEADSVWFVDVRTGEKRAEFATVYPPHEVALSGDGALAAITNYGMHRGEPGNHVQIADVDAGVVVRAFDVEGFERLHGVAFLEGDSLLALTSERTEEILVVSALDGVVRRRFATGGGAPHMLTLAGGWIYTANVFGGSIARIDPSGAHAPVTWNAAATRTEALAATPDGTEGWTASMESGEIIGIDGASGEVLARIGGAEVPYRLAVSSDGRTVVASDPGAGNLVLIDRTERAVRAVIDVDAAASEAGLGDEASPQGFVLSPDGHWAFVSTKAISRVAVVDLRRARVVSFLVTAAGPDGVAFRPAR